MPDKQKWPMYMYEAVTGLSIEDKHGTIAAFARRWGGVDEAAILRAVEASSGRKRLFALFALGGLRTASARARLLPFLDSAEELEQWVSAIRLGEMGERRAVPVLCSMLTGHLATRLEDYFVAGGLYDYWRGYAPLLLPALGDPVAVPALRQALGHLLALLRQDQLGEEVEVAYQELRGRWQDIPRASIMQVRALLRPTLAEPVARSSDEGPAEGEEHADAATVRGFHEALVNNLISYQDDIVFALGRLGGVGALAGLLAPEPLLHVWMVHLLMGELYERYTEADIRVGKLSEALEADLRRGLREVFGLERDEQERALACYVWTKLGSISMHYLHDAFERTRAASREER